MPPHLVKLSRTWPKVEPVLRFGHTGSIVELVRKGDVDFGIVLDNEDFSAFQAKEIFRGEYRLYKPKKVQEHSLNKFILSEDRTDGRIFIDE